MNNAASMIAWLIANFDAIMVAIMAVLTAGISVAMIIPGDQPEKSLQKIVDIIAKFSKKP